MVGIGAAVEGWYWTRMSWWERIPMFIAGILLIDPATLTDIIGLVMIAVITFIQYQKAKGGRDPGRREAVPEEVPINGKSERKS
jgi:TRAP-type uncharacterized transport system fused permease subunit